MRVGTNLGQARGRPVGALRGPFSRLYPLDINRKPGDASVRSATGVRTKHKAAISHLSVFGTPYGVLKVVAEGLDPNTQYQIRGLAP